MQRFLSVALVIAFASVAQPGLADRFLGRKIEIADGRTDRDSAAPLIVSMHGFLGTPANMRKKTRLNALARRHGFVVAYPSGRARKWNDGRTPNNRVDDVGYLTALIESLIASGKADPRLIFLAGHSNGGGMAMRMACEKPKLIRAISVVATKSPLKFQCSNGAPVPAIFFHGTKDPISPHAGRNADSRLGGALSSAATLKLWQRRNGCTDRARVQTIDAQDDSTSARIVRYKGCRAPLMFVEITGHGHDWPRPGARATRLQGPATRAVDASALSWQFFQNLGR